MSDFAPSAAAAQAADPNTKIVTRKHPAGAQGAYVSLKEVAHRILEGRLDPRVRAWAIQQLHKGGRPKSHLGRAQAILDGLRKKALYIPDPTQAEVIQSARLTLCLDETSTLCFLGGDCDDLCVAFGSAAMSVGIPVQVVGQSFDGSQTPTHVICSVQTENGEWLRVDPSSEHWPVGQASRATGEVTLDPFDEADPGLAGINAAPSGDYVGVGTMAYAAEPVPDASFYAKTLRIWYPNHAGGWHYQDRVVGVGRTLLGDPSLSDVQQLVAAKDYEIGQLMAHYAAASDWAKSDQAAFNDWGTDAGALQQRYLAAKNIVNTLAAAQSSLVPASYATATNAWNAVLDAVHHNPEQKGDLTDLDRRLKVATGTDTDYSKNPQPDKAMDADLHNTIDPAITAAKDAVDSVEKKVADTVKNEIPWTKIGLIGGGVLLAVVAVGVAVNKIV